MPTVNLGNIKSFSEGAGLYTHTFDEINLIHNFEGTGVFGYCKCIANYNTEHTIEINGHPINAINIPSYISAGAWIVFSIEDNSIYIFNKAEQFVVPDGEIVTPTDDPAIWCACAGINWYEIGQPDAKTLALSNEYCSQLFNSENAFAYYRRSSEIIKDTILDTNVISCIENLNYFTTQYVTSATTPEGYTSTMAGGHSNGAIWGAFGNNFIQYTKTNNTGNWAQLTIPAPIWPYKMEIVPDAAQNGNYLGGPPTFKWQASNDGSNWVDLSSFTGTVTTTKVQRTFYNTTGATEKYRYFRLYLEYSSTSTYWEVGYGKISGIL